MARGIWCFVQSKLTEVKQRLATTSDDVFFTASGSFMPPFLVGMPRMGASRLRTASSVPCSRQQQLDHGQPEWHRHIALSAQLSTPLSCLKCCITR